MTNRLTVSGSIVVSSTVSVNSYPRRQLFWVPLMGVPTLTARVERAGDDYGLISGRAMGAIAGLFSDRSLLTAQDWRYPIVDWKTRIGTCYYIITVQTVTSSAYSDSVAVSHG